METTLECSILERILHCIADRSKQEWAWLHFCIYMPDCVLRVEMLMCPAPARRRSAAVLHSSYFKGHRHERLDDVPHPGALISPRSMVTSTGLEGEIHRGSTKPRGQDSLPGNTWTTRSASFYTHDHPANFSKFLHTECLAHQFRRQLHLMRCTSSIPTNETVGLRGWDSIR